MSSPSAPVAAPVTSPVAAPVTSPVAAPVAALPADNQGKLKMFLDADGSSCDNKDFSMYLDQSRFTTVMKPGSCPAGMEVFSSPSAGDTSKSSALPFTVCMPSGFDTSRSSAYHSYQANYINCTIGSAGNIIMQVIIWILVVLAIIGLGFAFKFWWATHQMGVRIAPS